MCRLEFLNNWGSASSAALSERTDYLLMGLLIGHQNDAGILREIGAVVSGKCFLRIIEISHLNI